MRSALIVFAVLLFSCNKAECYDCVKETSTIVSNAIIQWTGMVEYDGCDWVIQVDSFLYHPKNLEPAYRENQAKVQIEYTITSEKFVCSMMPGYSLPVIEIIGIRK